MIPELKYFVTGDYPWIRETLAEAGFLVTDGSGLSPGESRSAALKSASVVLLVFGFGSPSDRRPSEWEIEAFREAKAESNIVGIPVLIGAVKEWSLGREFADLAPIKLVHFGVLPIEDTELRNRSILLDAIRRLDSRLTGRGRSSGYRRKRLATGPLLRLERVELIDIGCFESLTLNVHRDWNTILGDNAIGKSTLLRSIALGLCSESEAAALVGELPGTVRRNGTDRGQIVLGLSDPVSGTSYQIRTIFSGIPNGREQVQKETSPGKVEDFPWDRLFVCAYGTGRSREGTASHDEYSLLAALRPLFDEKVFLQNPELILLRQKNGLQRDLETRILNIMMIEDAHFDYTSQGPAIQGEWGTQAIRSLSDGYRSTLQWVLDFCAWAIYAGRFGEDGVQGGILLIDELEQHLHPRWQRHIVRRLREQFPTTQVFATTHTPLVAAGAADIESAQVVRLEGEPGGAIHLETMEPKEFWGKRADQVLTEAFGLITSRNPGSEDDLDRYAALLGKEPRSATEEEDFQALRTKLKAALSLGETETEREAERIVEKVLDELNTDLDKEHLDFEARQLLQDLLRPESEK